VFVFIYLVRFFVVVYIVVVVVTVFFYSFFIGLHLAIFFVCPHFRHREFSNLVQK
jgi:hypothetical protein